MAKPTSLAEHFASRTYGDAEAAMQHALEIHSQMPGKVSASLDEIMAKRLLKVRKTNVAVQGPAIAALGSFHQAILRVAPDYFNGEEYSVAGIMAEAFENQKVDLKFYQRVVHGVRKLNTLKLLEPLGKAAKVKIRETGESEVQRHGNLVEEVVSGGHTFLPRYWREYIAEQDVQKVARFGLVKALETKLPNDPEFGLHAVAHIAAAITAEVRRNRSTVVQVPQTVRQDQIKRDLQMLLNREAPSHHVLAFALAKLGRDSGEVARHLNVSQESFYQAYRRANRLLKTA